jgi:hypothetical protein
MISYESLASRIDAISSGMKNPNYSYLVLLISISVFSDILAWDLQSA